MSLVLLNGCVVFDTACAFDRNVRYEMGRAISNECGQRKEISVRESKTAN